MPATSDKIRYEFKAECGCRVNLMESHAPFMSGIENVIFERGRQLGKQFNDMASENANQELAGCASSILNDYIYDMGNIQSEWPAQRAAHVREKYGGDYVCRLRIAAALIAAEIDRIQMLALQPSDQQG